MANRRQLLVGGAAFGTTAWVAPSVLSLDRVAAAVGSGTPEVPLVSNGAVLISPPATNQEGTLPLDSNTNTFVWPEIGCEVLDNDLVVNRSTAGSFNGGSNQGTIIPAGTKIASYYAHGDRLDDGGTLTGQMTFQNQQILGLIYRTAQLNASSYLEAPATNYFNGPMEGNDTMVLSLAAGMNSVSWNMRFGPALDGIRVITTCD